MTQSRSRRNLALLAGGILLLVVSQQLSTRLVAKVIHQAASPFGDIRIVERHDGLRSLYTGEGRARQSAVYPGRPLHLESAYTRVAMIGPALTPPGSRILFVGLGGGAMPMFTRKVRPSAHIEVVEIDPAIVDVAREWFGFQPDDRLVVHVDDGRSYIERSPPGTYDLIVLDAFSDDEIPLALATREFLEAVRTALAPGGIVVSNLWGSNARYPAMLATYAAAFEHRLLVRVRPGTQRILVASADRPLDPDSLVIAAERFTREGGLPFDLDPLVQRGREAWPNPSAPVLTDSARD